ncbi:SDR family oxidoreductase [Sandarakinorhabdus rubra]|uniref:SDR family oxidoreductase n=1 Tax=Sandarakinorhabdus rubra TaxID=2672568 RepID=UPI0013DD0E5A|nr:SDR family oxidoreductase [Sandarakinorhabdus rubra]
MAILVTGGTKGIGLAIARRFAKPGTHVFLNYRADQAAAERARGEIEAAGAHCHLIQADVGTPAGAQAVLDAVAARTDRLDQLVHCAVKVVAEPLLTTDPQLLTEAINLNGTAIVYLVQAALPLFRPGSTVFFLSSRGSRTVIPSYAAVGAGKSLAESLVRYLAAELAPLGVRANCVAPSAVDTEALRQVYGDRTDEIMRQSAASNPSGRNVVDDDYCSLIEYLASPSAAMIQGQVIFVTGGSYLAA